MPWASTGFRFLLSALFWLSLAGCGGHSQHGQIVGNGGDLLQQSFEDGRQNALDVVSRLSERRLRGAEEALSADGLWLIEHRAEVGAELRALRWQKADERTAAQCPHEGARWCACTRPALGEKVWLSPEHCHAASEDALGELLLHETLHHFLGADETRVYHLSSLVYSRWSHLAAFRAPVPIVAPEGTAASGAASWNGSSLLTWNAASEDRVYRFRPESGWDSIPLSPPPVLAAIGEIELSSTSSAELYALVRGPMNGKDKPPGVSMLLEGQGWRSDLEGGLAIDLKSGSWRRLLRVATPAGREGRWLGETPDGEFDWMWSVFSGVKKLPPTAPSGAPLFAFLPSGSAELSVGQVAGNGIRWQATSLPAPFGKPPTVAIGTAQALVLYDGEVGQCFDPRSGVWSPLPAGGPAPLNGHLLTAVDGETVHIVGKEWMAWSTRRHAWETIQGNMGGLAEWATALYLTEDGALFWDARTRRGFLWAR